MAANRLATDGQEWGRHAKKYNSGTGNKEWMIADFMKFRNLTRQETDHRKRDFQAAHGLLYIAEQIPGLFHIEDKTDMLVRNTYWASYGLPFFLVGPVVLREERREGYRELKRILVFRTYRN